MRYSPIANRQPINGCLFLFLLLLACRSADHNNRRVRVEARSVLIEYAGDPRLKQSDFIQINGKLFWHDSMYVFHRNSTDTTYLPTQRYVADQPPGGRPVYSYANALSCIINISEALSAHSDTSAFVIDVNRLYAGKLIIRAKGKKPVEIIASSDYPLRIMPLKD